MCHKCKGCITSLSFLKQYAGRLVRSRKRWAGHLVRMDASKLAESRGGKTSRTQEKGKATAEMGGLREEGHEKIGGG